jgi:hypothetical protein
MTSAKTVVVNLVMVCLSNSLYFCLKIVFQLFTEMKLCGLETECVLSSLSLLPVCIR